MKKTFGFLTIPVGVEIEHWREMGQYSCIVFSMEQWVRYKIFFKLYCNVWRKLREGFSWNLHNIVLGIVKYHGKSELSLPFLHRIFSTTLGIVSKFHFQYYVNLKGLIVSSAVIRKLWFSDDFMGERSYLIHLKAHS